MAVGLQRRPGQRSKRPTPAASVAAIRRMGYEGEKQRQITNGWWARGHEDAEGNWRPDLGDTDDVFVYLPMSAPHEREFFSDGHECRVEFADGGRHVGCRQKYIMLSDVPNKRAVAGRPSTGEFVIEPPEYDQLDEILELMRQQVPQSVAELQTTIAKNDEVLTDPGALMKGEAPQLREINRRLKKRIERLRDPETFNTLRIYTAMVKERMQVLKAQQKPDSARHAELQREYDEWQQHLDLLDRAAEEPEEAPAKDSASSSRRSTSSTAPATAS